MSPSPTATKQLAKRPAAMVLSGDEAGGVGDSKKKAVDVDKGGDGTKKAGVKKCVDETNGDGSKTAGGTKSGVDKGGGGSTATGQKGGAVKGKGRGKAGRKVFNNAIGGVNSKGQIVGGYHTEKVFVLIV